VGTSAPLTRTFVCDLLRSTYREMRIGERLIAEGLVTPEQVEQALRGQIVHGGRLGTNLVERLYIQLDTLAEALGRQHDMPAALQRHFDLCDASVQRELTPEVAARWHAIPIGRVSEDPPQVAVAVSDPLTDDGEKALSLALGAPIVAAIAPELRILYYLEKIYGVERLNRFMRAPSDRTGTDADNRRRYIRTLDESVPSAPNALARVAIRRVAVPTSGEYEQPEDIDSLEAGLRMLRRCNSRSCLGTTLLRILATLVSPPLSGAMILLLRQGVATGWKGIIGGEIAPVVESVAFLVNGESILSTAVHERRLFTGAPQDDAAHAHLWTALQTSVPATITAAPACLGDTPVAALYGFANEPIDPGTEECLAELARSLGSNFERLLRAAER